MASAGVVGRHLWLVVTNIETEHAGYAEHQSHDAHAGFPSVVLETIYISLMLGPKQLPAGLIERAGRGFVDENLIGTIGDLALGIGNLRRRLGAGIGRRGFVEQVRRLKRRQREVDDLRLQRQRELFLSRVGEQVAKFGAAKGEGAAGIEFAVGADPNTPAAAC